MKKIFINMRFLTRKITGVERFSYELCKAIDKIIEENDALKRQITLIGLMPNQQINNCYQYEFKNIRIVKCGLFKGYLWEQIDLFLSTLGNYLINLTVLGPLLKLKQCIVIHDVTIYVFPNSYKKIVQIIYKLFYFIMPKVSRNVFCISDFSRDEIHKYLGVNIGKANIIPNGIDHLINITPDYSIVKKYGLEDLKYVLVVGGASEHKNLPRLIKAFKIADLSHVKLVVTGATTSSALKNLSQCYVDEVLHTGYVDDSQLMALYLEAYCFIFPSLYEGFGIPPLEAMYCNCPVIASNAASIPEVCGDAALYFDQYNEHDIADKIKAICADEKLRIMLTQNGNKNIKMRLDVVNWQSSANNLLQVILCSEKIS